MLVKDSVYLAETNVVTASVYFGNFQNFGLCL